MKSFLAYTYLVVKKTIFIGTIISVFCTYLMADTYELPSHDEIKKEVNLLTELNQLKNSDATILQKFKDTISRMDGCIEITRENAPGIYKIIDAAAIAIGVDIKSKFYLDTASPWPFIYGFNPGGARKNGIQLAGNLSGEETYLYIGSKFLFELTPAETKAFLEYTFIFIKDELFKKMGSLLVEILKIEGYWIVGSLVLLYFDQFFFKRNPEYKKSKIANEIALYFLAAYFAFKVGINFAKIVEAQNKIAQHANLSVASREAFLSGLKKLKAMAIKKDPSKTDEQLSPMIEQEMQDIVDDEKLGEYSTDEFN